MEQWRDIPGFEGLYQVSSFGRILSTSSQSLVPQSLGKNGYAIFNITKDGKRHLLYVHSTVAKTFIGPRSQKMDCCHIDGCRTNNRVENLRWGTRKENCKDSKCHGTWRHGQGHQNAKLSDAIVIEMREKIANGMTTGEAAKAYGVSAPTVSGIKTRKWWTHI